MRLRRAVAIHVGQITVLAPGEAEAAAVRLRSLVLARRWTPEQFARFMCTATYPDPLEHAIANVTARAGR